MHLILTYLDDLTVHSKKRSDHLQNLRLVFQRCHQYNLCLNPLKCVFCVITGRLLGFIVSQKVICVDPLKVQAIKEVPPPWTLRQLQSLHGKANFLKHFVPDYTTCTQGFLRLLCYDIPFKRDDYAQKVFDALKETLSSAALIGPPDYDKDYILYLSASDSMLARVLVQEGPDEKEHVIYYVKKTLSGPALRYEPEGKTALALIYAIQKLCHYIILRTTTVIADINPIKYLLTHRLMNHKNTCWIVILQ